jgi:hypothetical protein
MVLNFVGTLLALPLNIREALGHILSCVRSFYKRAVSDLDRSMHRSQWV